MLKHLTDDQIQEYLDGNAASRQRIAGHLKTCERCGRALQHYSMLYSQIKQQEFPGLSANFADAVMAGIDNTNTSFARSQFFSFLLSFIGLCAAMAAGFYYSGIKSIQQLIPTELAIEDFVVRLFTTLEPVIDGLNLNFTIIVFAAILLLFFSFFDNLIQHRNPRL